MVGRSTLVSWIGLGALASTPRGASAIAANSLGQVGDPAQHGVGALLGLDGQDQAVADHGALPDVQRADGPGHVEGAVHVGDMAVLRRVLAQGAARQGHLASHLVGAFDHEAFLLELGQQAAQQGVVALARGVDQAWDHGQAAQVGLEGREVRTIDDAGEAHRLAALVPQRLERLAELAQPDLDPG
jgi:hypothetical protein